MNSPNVQEFCERLWDLRESAANCMPCGGTISRMLALAVADDVLLRPGYDPALDRRVEWCGVVAAERRLKPHVRAAASAELEFCVGYQLGRLEVLTGCGKDLAAGEGVAARASEPLIHQTCG